MNRNDSHRKIRTKLIEQGTDLLPIKIAENLTEAEAFSLESKIIDIVGIKAISKFGLLTNLDEGLLYKERRQRYPNSKLLQALMKKHGSVYLVIFRLES